MSTFLSVLLQVLAILVASAQTPHMSQPQIASSTTPRKQRPWWVYLLIALGALLLLGVVLIVAGVAYVASLRGRYTATAPRTFQKAPDDPARRKELQKNWEDFAKAVLSRQAPPPFKIEADDLNTFFAGDRNMREHLHLVITNDQLVAEFSMPLDPRGQNPFLRGRYFNGSVPIRLDFQEGWLTANLGSVEANGNKAPDWIIKRFQGRNLVGQLDKDKNFVNLMQEIDTIQITNGAILLTPRKP